MKIKIDIEFICWKNINVMIFDTLIKIDSINIDGIIYFNVLENKHYLNYKAIKELNYLGINEEKIYNALNDKYYEFEIIYNIKGIDTILIPFK